MTYEFGAFVSALCGDPVLAVIVVLTLGATMVNGATDASNAISPIVGTKSLSPNKAIVMTALCNFIGLCGVTFVSSAVADTIFRMVDFGSNSHAALVALMAAMIAIIVWGMVAWVFSIPTSQSHSLIAGITGAAIALYGGLGAVNMGEWIKVIYGLVVSTILGFGLGWLLVRAITKLFSSANRFMADGFFKYAQIVTGAGMGILHGAQDGQKFLSICMLGIMLAMSGQANYDVQFPLWTIAMVSLSLACGTALGGKRIIKSVGLSMVKLDRHQGFAASLSGCICVALATFTGLPVSTTHTSTTAVMGVGAAKSIKQVKWDMAGRMVLTWVLTFPGCGLLAFVFTHIFLMIF